VLNLDISLNQRLHPGLFHPSHSQGLGSRRTISKFYFKVQKVQHDFYLNISLHWHEGAGEEGKKGYREDAWLIIATRKVLMYFLD
jgi:hypothetical protein